MSYRENKKALKWFNVGHDWLFCDHRDDPRVDHIDRRLDHGDDQFWNIFNFLVRNQNVTCHHDDQPDHQYDPLCDHLDDRDDCRRLYLGLSLNLFTAETNLP